MALTQADTKRLRALQRKKMRYEHGRYLAQGDKIVQEHLQYQPAEIHKLYALETWLVQHAAVAARIPTDRIQAVSIRELKRISTLYTPNQVLAEVNLPLRDPSAHVLRSGFAFYLSGIRNPGNMGTIIRIADWFGFPYVYCSMDCVDPYNPKVVQAAMGSLLRIAVLTMPIDLLSHCTLYGADLQGEDASQFEYKQPGILAIGSEAEGLANEIIAALDHRICIAGGDTGAESLNAGVAAGILAAFAHSKHSSA